MTEQDRRPEAKQPHPDQHHRNVMLIATLAVIVLLGIMIWVVQLIVAQQKLERCLATGRRDCLQISTPPRNGDPGPAR